MSKLTLEKKVRAILQQDEESRNDDIRLTQLVWWNYHRDAIQMIDKVPYVNMRMLHKLPREDGIKRVRAHIQNDLHELVPTRREVAEKRGMNEIEWRNYLNYPTGDTL